MTSLAQTQGSVGKAVLTRAQRSNRYRLLIVALLAVAAIAAYMLLEVNFSNEKLFMYSMRIRAPKVIAMSLAAVSIGGATLIFQSIINNTIVTPCLLGMNSLYTLIHTAVAFVAGMGSIFVLNQTLSFFTDLVIMGVTATFIYSYLFKKTRYNVLYVLLIGTVLSSFFGSIQSTIIRVMDPNEYDQLLATLVASFSNIHTDIIIYAIVAIILITAFLWRDLMLLDVLTLGKDQAINLGVDYDRCVRRLLLGVTLYIAVATAMIGPISFLGLIIANLSRQFLKTYRHTQLILGSILFGLVALIAGECIVEHVFDYAIPVSVFVGIAGGVYFLYLLLTAKRV